MILTILDGLLPVAFVIALGWLAGRTGVLKHADAEVLATYVIRFALPFALLEAALETSPEKIFEPTMAICLTGGLMGSYLVALAAGRFWFRHDLKTATMQALVCGFPDMAYFGAPILAAVFGPSGFLLVLIGNLVTSIIMLPLTIVLTHLADGHDQEHGWKDSLRVLGDSLIGAATNPIVWLPIAGVLCSLVHLSLPHPLTASIAMVARSAGGTSLFALGLMLYGEKVTLNSNVLVNLGIKNFLQPGLMLAAAAVLGMTLTATREAVITGATPTATAAAMFALRNKTYTADATSTILLSTILGIFTAAGLIALFAAYPA
jgi:predicted permease